MSIIPKKAPLRRLAGEVLEFLLDTLFPQPEEIARIERMNIHEFFVATKPPRRLPHQAIYVCRSYKSTLVKKAVLELKYKKNKRIIDLFAEMLHLYITSLGIESAYIVPIPAHNGRLLEYGFNQTELLAQAIETLSSGAYLQKNALAYTHERDTQKHKNRFSRLSDSKNMFKVIHPEQLSDRSVIVLDDVVTTGATCISAMRALRDAGVKNILTMAIAH